jgi:uncharacterized protein (TIGR01777 family)
MRILLTGATGLIGRELGKALAARGDTLVCLVRDAAAARRRLPFPAFRHAWDHRRPVPAAALDGVEAIVHLAGEPVAEARWTSTKKALIRDSRVLGTRQLVRAVLAHGARVRAFVHGSASGIHGDRGDELLSAASSAGTGFLADVVQRWEAELQPLADRRPDVRVPVVRTGIVLAREGGALAEMLPLFRLSAAGRLGSGRQWMSWIHLDDIVRLFLHALDADCAGVLEGVAPYPATNAQFTSALCRALGVVENLPAPPAAIQLLYGERAAIVLGSARLVPAATQAAGFRFRFETMEQALDDLCAPLRDGVWQRRWEQWLPQPAAAIWSFFGEAANLNEITPPWVNFRILGVSTPQVCAGTRLDYALNLSGVPVRWQTLIETWEPPQRFIDVQTRGPYDLWHHTHEFVPLAGGTLMRDIVRYRLPAGWLGSAVGGWKVARDVGAIFEFRARRIDERFGG